MKYLLFFALGLLNIALWTYAATRDCPHEKLGLGACASFFSLFSLIGVGVMQ